MRAQNYAAETLMQKVSKGAKKFNVTQRESFYFERHLSVCQETFGCIIPYFTGAFLR